MDKQLLVERAERLLADLRQQEIVVDSYRWSPVYPGLRNTSYRLGIVAPSLGFQSIKQQSQFLAERIFAIFAPEERGKIFSVLSYNTTDEMNQDLDGREGVGRPVVEPYWPD